MKTNLIICIEDTDVALLNNLDWSIIGLFGDYLSSVNSWNCHYFKEVALLDEYAKLN